MPFSLADITRDPDLGQPITIVRSSGSFVAGVWRDTPKEIAAYGVVLVADAEALAQVPEGDRVTGSLQLLCAQPVYETSEDRQAPSDRIRWRGKLYRVQSVEPWQDFGFSSAILVRMAGA